MVTLDAEQLPSHSHAISHTDLQQTATCQLEPWNRGTPYDMAILFESRCTSVSTVTTTKISHARVCFTRAQARRRNLGNEPGAVCRGGERHHTPLNTLQRAGRQDRDPRVNEHPPVVLDSHEQALSLPSHSLMQKDHDFLGFPHGRRGRAPDSMESC